MSGALCDIGKGRAVFRRLARSEDSVGGQTVGRSRALEEEEEEEEQKRGQR